ncbi:unnamed protein product [Linum trigynum]|uniref:Uncharacterized protein n=1 Tax=Linum trigynum TaxID=586398 RepID=A0AAV2FW57_9ROSI
MPIWLERLPSLNALPRLLMVAKVLFYRQKNENGVEEEIRSTALGFMLSAHGNQIGKSSSLLSLGQRAPFSCYSVKFSPFYEDRLAVAAAQNFGIIGNSRVHVFSLSEIISFDTADGVDDLAWSESHDSLLIAAVADGSVGSSTPTSRRRRTRSNPSRSTRRRLRLCLRLLHGEVFGMCASRDPR